MKTETKGHKQDDMTQNAEKSRQAYVASQRPFLYWAWTPFCLAQGGWNVIKSIPVLLQATGWYLINNDTIRFLRVDFKFICIFIR